MSMISRPSFARYDLSARTKTQLRPWLQDFSLQRRYTLADVRAQIRAAERGGAKGWLLWNAAVQYTDAALATRRLLHQRVTVDYHDTRMADVLQDLRKKVRGLVVELDPQAVSAGEQKITHQAERPRLRGEPSPDRNISAEDRV